MKKFVYIIIGVMAMVIIANLFAVEDHSMLKFENNGQIIEIDPIY